MVCWVKPTYYFEQVFIIVVLDQANNCLTHFYKRCVSGLSLIGCSFLSLLRLSVYLSQSLTSFCRAEESPLNQEIDNKNIINPMCVVCSQQLHLQCVILDLEYIHIVSANSFCVKRLRDYLPYTEKKHLCGLGLDL